MQSCKKTFAACFLIISLLVYPLSAVSETVEWESARETSSPEFMAVDIFFARPLGLVAIAGGTLVFLVSWPFSALGGNSTEAWKSLVVTPAEFTFQRPLGHFE